MNDFYAEITLKIPCEYEEENEIKDFIEKLLSPYYEKIEATASLNNIEEGE